MISQMRQAASRFKICRRGSVAIMGAFAFGLLGMATVATIEFTEVSETKAQMQDRLDSAVLFATLRKDLDDPDVNTALQAETKAFLLQSVRQAGLRAADVTGTFRYDPQTDRVYGEATFTAASMFVGTLMGGRTIKLRAEGAPKSPVDLEIALVLDVSGSMKWEITQDNVDAAMGSRRIDALSEGVEALVDYLEGDDRVEPKYTVVPYATSVDLTDIYDAASAVKGAKFRGANGRAMPNVCKGGRKADPSTCDPIPNPNLSLILNPSPVGAWASERYKAKNGKGFTLSIDGPKPSQKIPVITQGPRTSACDVGYIATFGQKCLELLDDYTSDTGAHYVEHDYFAPRVGILGLTEQPQDVRDFMTTLEPRGGTAGHIGTVWGLYSLTPEWSELFPHKDGPPDTFGERTRKVMIIMTDGDFTNTHDSAMTTSESYDYFQTVCTLAREEEVTVYAVGLRSSATTDAELTACTGSADKYFPAGTRDALITAFEDIAQDAADVRLTN